MMADYDAIVVGAGPSGSICAIEMARSGLNVLMVDKGEHPRHRLGESFMPKALQILSEMGFEEDFRKLPHVAKVSGEFLLGHETDHFIARFEKAWPVGERNAFNVERAPFDEMLCQKAREAGVEVKLLTKVTKINSLSDEGAHISTADGDYTADWLVDCSGPSTVIGRHLKIRKPINNKTKTAYYTIGENVKRPEIPNEGAVVGIMHDDAWFWLIPLDETRTSIGVVLDKNVLDKSGVSPTRILNEAINRSPRMKERCFDAIIPEQNECVANFSYSCGRWAGPGYFLVGDAGAFVDPIFSTGATLGMQTGRDVAAHITDIKAGKLSAEEARAKYEARTKRVTNIFFTLVDAYYKQPFRELFLSGKNPLNVRRALLTLLAGHAFDAPLYLRWRLSMLMYFVKLQAVIPIVRRRTRHELFPQ